MPESDSSFGSELRMPLPKANKPPLVANLFDVVRGSNVQLLPLFPYESRGDIVPCAVARRNRPGEDQGSFWHENSVDEVMICFGGNGRVRTGEVRVGPKTHGVGGGAPTTESSTVNCVTQRQAESGSQEEAFVLFCEQCSVPVYRNAYSGLPRDDAGGDSMRAFPPTEGAAACVAAWNSDATIRTCKACGHVNKPFPGEFWGWEQHMLRTSVAEEAYRLLQEAGAQA